MNFYEHEFQPVHQMEILWTNHLAKISANWFTSVKNVKQFRKWLQARDDQYTLGKAWSDHIAYCYSKKLDWASEKESVPNTDINPTNLHHVTGKEYNKCSYRSKKQNPDTQWKLHNLESELLGWKLLEGYFVICNLKENKFKLSGRVNYKIAPESCQWKMKSNFNGHFLQ